MEKKFFILIEEEMKKHRAYDSIGDWLFELEENKKNEEDKNQENKDIERIRKIEYLQKVILRELPFKKLVWLAVIFSKLEDEEHKKFLNLSRNVRNALDKKWGDKISEIEEE